MTQSAYVARLLAGSILAVSPLALCFASPAQAADVCSPVIDEADVLVDDSLALDHLSEAEIHVVAFESVPDADIDRAVLEMRSKCPDWQNESGGWGANDLVFAVSVKDRKTALHYGPQFESKLGRDRYRAAMDAMNPRFANGDFTGGVNAGIGYVGELLSDGPDTEAIEDDGVATADVPWAWILGVPAGGAALGGLGVAGVRTRRRLASRATLRAGALALTDEAATKFMELESLTGLVTARVQTLPDVDDERLTALRSDHADALQASRAAIEEYLAHTDRWTAAAVARTDLDSAGAARVGALEMRDQLLAATVRLESLEADITALEERNARTPQVLDDALTRATVTEEVLGRLDSEGYRTAALRSQLSDVRHLVTAARAEHSENLWGAAADKAATASDQARSTHSAASGLPERRATIEADVALATERAQALETARAQGEGELAGLTDAFHTSCVEDVVTQFREGAEAHRAAHQDLAAASAAVTMDQQRYDEAESAMRRAWSLLDTADAAFALPAAQRERLDGVQLDLTKRIADAHTDLASLRQRVAGNAEALEHLEGGVDWDRLTAAVTVVEDELAAERPPLLSLDTAMTEASRDIAVAQAEVDAIIRRYEEVRATVARAERAVRDAETKSGRRRAGSRSKSLAGDARRSLRSVEDAASLNAMLLAANTAILTSSQAERAAQTSISSSDSSSWFGGGGGGGSSDWGGGGGGSSDWGGGGSSDGGGGSSSW